MFYEKNYRWELFSIKILKFYLFDLLCKVCCYDFEVEDFEVSIFYFRNGFDRWVEFNLLKIYVFFRLKVICYIDFFV